MKQLLFVLIALLLVSVLASGQTLLQRLPTQTGGTQATRAAMLKGPHDFTPDSGAVNTFGTDSLGVAQPHPTGTGTTSLCNYCHSPHVPKDGIATPLWARASLVGSGRTWGYYQDANTIPSGYITDPVTSDNYSAYCLSCHDGSTGILAASAYEAAPYGLTGGSSTKVAYSANVVNGEYNLQHVHPVNFDYNGFVTNNPQEFYAAENNGSVWHGDNGSGQVTTVRLFNGTMQCPTCHNPHMKSGIGLVYSSSYGKLCVTCHKK
jgi:predicted CXXCH cytochrome family protein